LHMIPQDLEILSLLRALRRVVAPIDENIGRRHLHGD
jgi:hypothetical protein